MITPILQKQLESELEFIYANLVSFLKTFFTEATLELLDNDNLDLYVAFTHSDIYVQCHWVDNGEGDVSESSVSYDEYNTWWKGIA